MLPYVHIPDLKTFALNEVRKTPHYVTCVGWRIEWGVVGAQGVLSERDRHSQSFHLRCQLSKTALWEKFPNLSAPVFAFVPSEPALLTLWRRTNEIHRGLLWCPSPLTAARQ